MDFKPGQKVQVIGLIEPGDEHLIGCQGIIINYDRGLYGVHLEEDSPADYEIFYPQELKLVTPNPARGENR